MGAAEIIREIAKLSAEEKAQVIDYVRQLADERGEIQYAADEVAEASSEKVFSTHPELLKKLAQ